MGDSERHNRFRFYFCGLTPLASLALGRLRALCDRHLPGGYAIEMIDIEHDPKRAARDNVIAVPCVERDAPSGGTGGGRTYRAVGSLADEANAVKALGLGPTA